MQIGLLHLWWTILLQTKWVYSTVSCPSGDTPGIVKNGQTCSQLISSTSYECYDATIETSCCASCNTIATYISGCQYGDRVASCVVDLCPYYPDPSECCSTYITTTTTKPSTTPTITSTILAITTTTTPTTTTLTMMTPATITTTLSPAASNATTGSTSQASSSAGLIAGAVVASVAGASIMVGLTYLLFRLFKGSTSRRDSSVQKEIVLYRRGQSSTERDYLAENDNLVHKETL
ncbi:hypothetical protein ACJMK2_015105 [Sinanodonta woodiana]|uniref:Uncharacterized protein n=1 Tax=Sinanodonta woodiana TaxID=1069815 RepID=A0ABD3V519_SINWO